MLCDSKLVHMPHMYIFYWPYAKIVEYHLFGQFSKFSELAR
jgi:hypothetical protein